MWYLVVNERGGGGVWDPAYTTSYPQPFVEGLGPKWWKNLLKQWQEPKTKLKRTIFCPLDPVASSLCHAKFTNYANYK